MAWLYQRGKIWWIGYRLHGKQQCITTRKQDHGEALKALATFEAMEGAQALGRLNEKMFGALSGRQLPNMPLGDAVRAWLDECKRTTAKSTHDRYEDALKPFLASLHEAIPVRGIAPVHITEFLNAHATNRAPATVNFARRCLSIFFRRCVANGWCMENPVAGTKPVRIRKQDRIRRAYTMDELRLVFRQAPTLFWRYMVHGAYYSGLRLGDLICVRKGDFSWGEKPELRVIARKNDASVKAPLAAAFALIAREAWENTPKLGNPEGYLWPKEAERYQRSGSGWFSNEYYERVLVPCGLAPARPSWREKQADIRRQRSPLTFHSLRHSFVSALKAAGASQAVATELAGHTDAVSSLYTHVSPDQLRAAIEGLPVIG